MFSLSGENQADLTDAFILTFRFLVALVNIDKSFKKRESFRIIRLNFS